MNADGPNEPVNRVEARISSREGTLSGREVVHGHARGALDRYSQPYLPEDISDAASGSGTAFCSNLFELLYTFPCALTCYDFGVT